MTDSPITAQRWNEIAETHRRGLMDTVSFWERHAVDRDCGGFLFYLDRAGQPYGTDKPVWLLGRAVWLFAKLYTEVEQRPEWLELARHGWQFIDRHAFYEHDKIYFLLDRQGRGLRKRRHFFSEVFGVLAATALAEASDDPALVDRAEQIFGTFDRAFAPSETSESRVDAEIRPTKGLAPRMFKLLLADTLALQSFYAPYEQMIDRVINEIFRDFVKPEDGCVLEIVGPNGERRDDPEGRTMNPGHAFEVAGFMLAIARRRKDDELAARAAQLVAWSFERGWDREYGGLYHFVDVDGKPPTQLEHDMKLWWPHCEALYASLLAHVLTGEAHFARMYEQLHEWTLAHFPDRENGEWYGYLHRDGSLSTPIKGGPWKGPFHVPRMQLRCWRLAGEFAT